MMLFQQVKRIFPSLEPFLVFISRYGRFSIVSYFLAIAILGAMTQEYELHTTQLNYKLHFYGRLEGPKCQEGILYYDYLVHIYPYSAKAYYELGNLYSECHEPQNAQKVFEKAVALKPDVAEYRQALEKSEEALKKR